VGTRCPTQVNKLQSGLETEIEQLGLQERLGAAEAALSLCRRGAWLAQEKARVWQQLLAQCVHSLAHEPSLPFCAEARPPEDTVGGRRGRSDTRWGIDFHDLTVGESADGR
jgi:hypothetical protein